MAGFGFSDNRATYDALLKAHAEKYRHYHTQEHISACLRHLDNVREEVEDWKTMALAFWFHDSIYKPFSATNERDSADWAIEFLKTNHAKADETKHVEALIVATCHNAGNQTGDMQTLVDIDLSILGARPDVYDLYEINIRKEYRRVPWFIFRNKRKELLRGFLNKSRIYGSARFYDLLEKKARENLSRAILKL